MQMLLCKNGQWQLLSAVLRDAAASQVTLLVALLSLPLVWYFEVYNEC